MARCPRCGVEVEAHFKYCPHCGEALELDVEALKLRLRGLMNVGLLSLAALISSLAITVGVAWSAYGPTETFVVTNLVPHEVHYNPLLMVFAPILLPIASLLNALALAAVVYYVRGVESVIKGLGRHGRRGLKARA